MKIPETRCDTSFGLKFYRNKSFEDVVNYAVKNNKLSELDYALGRLLKVEGDDILIVHGRDQYNRVFSSFSAGKRSVRNSAFGMQSAAAASYSALMELVETSNQKLAKLLGKKVAGMEIKPDAIINKYSVK